MKYFEQKSWDQTLDLLLTNWTLATRLVVFLLQNTDDDKISPLSQDY